MFKYPPFQDARGCTGCSNTRRFRMHEDARDVQIPAVSGCTRIAEDGKNMCLQDCSRVLDRMAGMAGIAVQFCTPETTRMFDYLLVTVVSQ